jgi:hypothetical protein
VPQIAERLQFSVIDDFRPGIWSTSARTNTAGGIKAPLGSANPTYTFRCYALPSGALAPLPANTAVISVPAPDGGGGGTDNPLVLNNSTYFVTLLRAVGLIVPTNAQGFPDELIFGVQYLFNNGGGQPIQPRVRVMRLQLYSASFPYGPTADTVFSLNSSAQGPNQISGQTSFVTRIHPTDYTQPGVPVVVFDSNIGVNPEPIILIWPNPNTPGINGGSGYSSLNSGGRAQVLGHQGRVVGLMFTTYSHPGTLLTTNEQVSFTDPPNSFPANFGTQNEVFVPEYPHGYGAWGSMSIGELFLVKNNGGGVYVTGDIANPTITKLPGVQSTGGIASECSPTPAGLIYPTSSSGVYSWNGGSTANKISHQLDDNFWKASPANLVPNFGITCKVEAWNDWLLVSNSWLYDTVTQSWWRLDDPSNTAAGTNAGPGAFQWYSRSWQDNLMYCSTYTYKNSNFSTPIFVYNRNTPASDFQYQCHPIPVTQVRMVDVRKIFLVAQGSGTVTISLIDERGNVKPYQPITVSQSTPQRFEFTVGVQGYNLALRLKSTGVGSGPAPLIHTIGIGYHEASHAGIN